MNRFLAVQREATTASSSLNSSMVSNGGYETAMDESHCSSNATLYYSMDDKTLENPADASESDDAMDDDVSMHSVIEKLPTNQQNPPMMGDRTVLTPIVENRNPMFSPKRNRNVGFASTPLQLADMKTPDSSIGNKSKRLLANVVTCKSVATSPVSTACSTIDQSPIESNQQDDTMLPVDDATHVLSNTPPSSAMSTAVDNATHVLSNTPPPSEMSTASILPVMMEESKPLDMKNAQSETNHLIKTVRNTISNNFRRSKRLSVVAAISTASSSTSIAITKPSIAKGTRMSRRTMAIPTNPGPSQLDVVPEFSAPKPIQRHALRKTIAKPATPQRRRSVRASLALQTIVAKPRTPSGKVLRANPKTKTPVRLTRRQTIALNKHSLEPPPPSTSSSATTHHPSLSLGQTSFDCPTCHKQFLQLSTLKAHQRTHDITINGHTSQLVANKCSHCDKSFALAQTLRTHLEQKCDKISALERRKLLAAAVPSALLAVNATRPTRRTAVHAAHSGVYRTPNRKMRCNKCKITFLDMALLMEHNALH